MARLTPRQERFVAEYLTDLNATKAAIRAGYSKRSAYSQGHDLLKKPEVQEAISKATAKRATKLELTAERVLLEATRLAFADPAQAFTPEGALLPLPEIPEELRRAVSGLDVEALFEGRGESREQVGTLRKIRFWSKPDALELLAKHLKLLTEKVEHGGKVEVARSPEDVEKLDETIARIERLLADAQRSGLAGG